MEENKPQARIGYNKQRDAFELLISTDGGETWGLELSCKCMRSEHDKKDDEPMFVSIELIEAMKRAISYGYEIVY